MSEFIYPSDIDLIYETEDELTRRLSSESSQEEVRNFMINTLKYVVSKTGDNLSCLADSENEAISQFQNAIINVTIDDEFYSLPDYSGFVVILHISAPSDEPLSSINDFEYHFHLKPIFDQPAVYELNLNEVFGHDLVFGEVNTCQFKFQVLAKLGNSWDSYLQSTTQEMEFYKTNTNDSFHPDDLANAFITLNDINTRVQRLEELQ